MLIDMVAGYIIVFGIAWILNKKYFKENPVSSGKTLACLYFSLLYFVDCGLRKRKETTGFGF
jgi:hypothetical protein